ncbi:DNA-methyltransferase Dcm [Clostridium sp. ASBs410]|nr:DNA-methyltransferase Dcm [Clostridium sp. ASBs410]
MGLEVFENYKCDGQMEMTDYTGNRQLTHLSLFSGIGGLDLAAEWAGFMSVGQCEWADYPTKVLEKHWPDVERWRDIRELHADEFIRRTGIKSGELTVISGGFPCQPHSAAGLRKASSDERDLWPEYRRVVSEIKPRWVVAENVRGLLSSESGRFFRGILRDFADMGYDVGWCCYRAADVGAIHSRERIAIVAHSNSKHVERHIEKQIQRKSRLSREFYGRGIEKWTERSNVFEPKLLRNFNGAPDCVDRIKALGNMVVPPQFYPIFKAIAGIELHG